MNPITKAKSSMEAQLERRAKNLQVWKHQNINLQTKKETLESL